MRRVLFRVLVASVVISALMGIIALFSSDFGETEAKVLGSTLCVAGASILALACAAAIERGRVDHVARFGIGLSVAGFALILAGIWTEADTEGFWKSATSLVIGGCLCAHAALLSFAWLDAERAWLRPATLASTACLALLLLIVLWVEDSGKDLWRFVGVTAILGTAGTILTAVFGRVGRVARTEAPTAPGARGHCPACGHDAPLDAFRRVEA